MTEQRQALVLVLLAVGLSGCATRPRFRPLERPQAAHLALMSYNVNWGGRGAERVVAHIRRSNPDVVCLQETHQPWQKLLVARLGQVYPHRVFKHWGGAGGLGLLSRYPIIQAELLPPSAGWFPALLCRVQTPLGTIQLLNVHLRPPITEQGGVSASAYFASRKTRLAEVKAFLARTDPKLPLVITGNFNEDEQGKAVRWLLDHHRMADALSQFDERALTWEWPLLSGAYRLTDRYDHLLISQQLTCVDAKVTYVDASDHMPVEAVLCRKSR